MLPRDFRLNGDRILGAYKDGNIGLDRDLVLQKGTVSFYHFCRRNDHATPADLLGAVLAHEYGHHLVYMFHRRALDDHFEERDVRAVDEAFAVWFSEQITRWNVFREQDVRRHERANPDRLLHTYQRLRRMSRRFGFTKIVHELTTLV